MVEGRDLVKLEDEHGPGLFFENVRGWLGLEGGRELGETVNQAIQKTVAEDPGEMLARNNGVTFRATEVETGEGAVLKLKDASIINGRQTTGAMASVEHVDPSCRVQVKVVGRQATLGLSPTLRTIRIERPIELRLRATFAIKSSSVNLQQSASGSDWLATVVDEDRERQELFELLRALLIGLFCHKPGQIADNNYSHSTVGCP